MSAQSSVDERDYCSPQGSRCRDRTNDAVSGTLRQQRVAVGDGAGDVHDAPALCAGVVAHQLERRALVHAVALHQDALRPVIQTYNKVKHVFPTEGVTPPWSSRQTTFAPAHRVLASPTCRPTSTQTQVNASDAFLPGTAVICSDDGTVAKIDVPSRGSGTDAAATNALDELRDEIIPATFGGVDGVPNRPSRSVGFRRMVFRAS